MTATWREPVFTEEDVKMRPFLTPEVYNTKEDKISGRDVMLTCAETSTEYYEWSVSVRGPGVPGIVRVWCDKMEDINLIARVLLDAAFDGALIRT